MRLWHLSLLAIVVTGIVVGTLMSQDPGYVLISYGGVSLQTSFWIMLIFLFLVSSGIYFILRSTNIFLSTSERYRQWRTVSKKNKSTELTMKGLVLLQEGDFEQAERHLISGVRQGDNVVVNYLAAARAADAMVDSEKREKFLRAAEEAGSKGAEGKGSGKKIQAVQFARAEMAYARGNYQACIDSLKDCVRNQTSITLLQRAYAAIGDWDGMGELLPDLLKILKDEELVLRLRKQIICGKLSMTGLSVQSCKTQYKKLPKAVRNDIEVVKSYVSFLLANGEEEEAESIIRNSLKNHWHDDLLKAYGGLIKPAVSARLKYAHNWLKEHGGDVVLLNCIGRLYLQKGDIAEARNYFEMSLKVKANRDASEQLGLIFAEEGNLRESNRYFQQSLTRLPRSRMSS